jgi:redox-sensitive bicupin YhaK (pirin superfamily)
MLTLRRAEERGHVNHGWLDSYHTFSFGSYYDPEHLGFSNLRVINDDTVAPGCGFATHGHTDMEIVSYVLDGGLEHKDSMGNGSVIRPGDVQHMSAGSGVTHSEYHPSSVDPVRFLQIWLEPNRTGGEPRYAQKHFPVEDRQGRLVLLVSPDGRNGSIPSRQEALLYGMLLDEDVSHQQRLAADRRAYVHVARGKAKISGQPLQAGDGIAIEGAEEVRFQGVEAAEILYFDLP